MTATAAKPATPAVEPDEDDFFTKSGPMPGTFDEVRKFPRFYFRYCFTAIVHQPRGEGSPAEHVILTRDVSRAGLSVLHSEQLYPGQRILIMALNDADRPVEVQWCRRLAAQRYVAGCRFVKH